MAWLESHDVVPQDWESGWQQSPTREDMRVFADENKPAARFLVQQLAARFGVSVLISPVAHPDLNPVEMIWGTVKMALQRGNTRFTLLALKDHVTKEFDKITRAVRAKYEDHAIKRADIYRGLDAWRDEVEGDLEEQERDWEAVENDELNSDAVSTDEEGERSTEESSVGMSDDGKE